MNKEDLKQVKTVVKSEVDKLAQITAKGFLEIDKKFDKVDKKFDEIDKKFDKVDERFDKVESSITDLRITMDRRLNNMEEKMEKSADKMLTAADHMSKQFLTWKQENAFGAGIESRQNQQLENHEKRIVKIEQKIIL